MICISKCAHICEPVSVSMLVCLCVRTKVQIQTGRVNVRAEGRPGKHYSPGRDREGDGEKEKTEKRDPRRDVTLPNHHDGGKARSDNQRSSDSRKLYLLLEPT